MEDLLLYLTILLSYFAEETEMCELYTLINEQKIEITKINDISRQVSVPCWLYYPSFFNYSNPLVYGCWLYLGFVGLSGFS